MAYDPGYFLFFTILSINLLDDRQSGWPCVIHSVIDSVRDCFAPLCLVGLVGIKRLRPSRSG
jgi:hypothetical protein